MVNDERHGQWRITRPDGTKEVGQYNKYGLRQGEWTITKPNGTVKKQQYGGDYNSEGRKHGKWIEYDGRVTSVGDYNDGSKQGEWTYSYPNGQKGGGKFNQNGKKEGKWIEFGYDGTKLEGNYGIVKVYQSNKQGQWKFTAPDGTVSTEKY